MNYTAREVLQFTRENDVKFIRLAFSDIFGAQKNISIMPSELERAFDDGIAFDATAIPGFGLNSATLLLKPDPVTLAVLPWRPSQGRVIRMYCDVFNEDGSHFEGDFRYQLKQTIKKYDASGLTVKFGLESDFYLFELDEKGNPTMTPHDNASYFDIAPKDKGENVRRDVCLTLETMGLAPLTSHHERGPGQHEVALKEATPVDAADHFLTFKSVVKMIAERNGLHASFMPKPIKSEHGSGLHINLSLSQNNENLFNLYQGETVIKFTEGIVSHLTELLIFTNPLTNSYSRIKALQEKNALAPYDRSWLRNVTGQGEASRLELRSPDNTLNPYLVFNLMLNAGLNAIEGNGYEPLNDFKAFDSIPTSMTKALRISETSKLLKEAMSLDLLNRYLETKSLEWSHVNKSTDVHQLEIATYFDTSLT